MSPCWANSSVIRWMASSSAPMSNCTSARGGRRAGGWSWGVADMRQHDIATPLISRQLDAAQRRWTRCQAPFRRGRGFIAARVRFTDNSRLFFPARTVSTDPQKDTEPTGGLRNTLYKKETRSKRRMTPLRRFAWRIVAAVGVFLIKIFWRTCRVVRVVGDEHTEQALKTT